MALMWDALLFVIISVVNSKNRKIRKLIAALVDRLTHKAHLVNMSGESYRLKETKLMMGN